MRFAFSVVAMPQLTLTGRVVILEENVDALNRLPDRVSAVEMQLVFLRDEFVALRTEMRTEFSTVRDELRSEIRSGDEETRRQMRVLHEDMISRIALLQEGQTQSNGTSRQRTRRNRRRRR
jgi:hypothetical protein